MSGTSPTSAGSLHVLHSSEVVDTLFQSGPDYEGVTGLWSIPLRPAEVCSAFIIISFASGSRAMTAGTRMSKFYLETPPCSRSAAFELYEVYVLLHPQLSCTPAIRTTSAPSKRCCSRFCMVCCRQHSVGHYRGCRPRCQRPDPGRGKCC